MTFVFFLFPQLLLVVVIVVFVVVFRFYFQFYLAVNLARPHELRERARAKEWRRGKKERETETETKELKIKKTSRYNSHILYAPDESNRIIMCMRKFIYFLFVLVAAGLCFFYCFEYFLSAYFFYARFELFRIFFVLIFYFAWFHHWHNRIRPNSMSDENVLYLTQTRSLLPFIQSWNRKYNLKKMKNVRCQIVTGVWFIFILSFFFIYFFNNFTNTKFCVFFH